MAPGAIVEREMNVSGSESPETTVIIPTLNEARIIERTLERLARMEGNFEVIVVDNGSIDDTVSLASKWARTITSTPGRGPAYNAGFRLARGRFLLFLHADTALPPGAFGAIASSLADPGVVGGCFSVSFDDAGWQSRLVRILYRLFSAVGFFYGDSATFVRREVFESLGGFALIPIMEDFDFCLRLRRQGRTVRLPETVVTSSRRWRTQGFFKTAAVYLVIQGLYLLGVRSPRLFRLYEAIR